MFIVIHKTVFTQHFEHLLTLFMTEVELADAGIISCSD
jgi:hypothetical protein